LSLEQENKNEHIVRVNNNFLMIKLVLLKKGFKVNSIKLEEKNRLNVCYSPFAVVALVV